MASAEIKAVIFDCDGTLVDSEKISIAVLAEYVGTFGYRIEFADAMTRWAGGELPKIFSHVEETLGITLPEDHLEQFRSLQMVRLAKEVEPIEGADGLLAGMTAPFCVASNAPFNKMDLCLKTTGLERHFPDSHRFSAYTNRIWKPDPDLFLAAAKFLDVPPENCAVVEDSEFGIKGGLNAGMQVFAFDPLCKFEAFDVVRAATLDELQSLSEFPSRKT